MAVLYVCIVWLYCMSVLHGCIVCLYCIFVLYGCIVCLYCTVVLHGCIVCLYCMAVLYGFKFSSTFLNIIVYFICNLPKFRFEFDLIFESSHENCKQHSDTSASFQKTVTRFFQFHEIHPVCLFDLLFLWKYIFFTFRT